MKKKIYLSLLIVIGLFMITGCSLFKTNLLKEIKGNSYTYIYEGTPDSYGSIDVLLTISFGENGEGKITSSSRFTGKFKEYADKHNIGKTPTVEKITYKVEKDKIIITDKNGKDTTYTYDSKEKCIMESSSKESAYCLDK